MTTFRDRGVSEIETGDEGAGSNHRAPRPASIRTHRGGLSSVWFLLPVVAIWIIPVIIFVLAVPLGRSAEHQSLESPAVHLVRVGTEVNDGKQAVDVSLTLPAPVVVKAAVSGVVTDAVGAAGSSLTQGSVLVTINGAPVLAFVAAAPLYRDIAAGQTGPDVHSAGVFLASQGLMPAASISTSYTAAMRLGIDALEKKYSQPVDGVLHQSLVGWVPESITTMGSPQLHVGDDVSAGSPIFQSSGAPTAATFAVTGSDTNQAPTEPAGKLRLTAGAPHVDFKSLSLDRADMTAVYGFLQKEDGSGIVSSKAQGSNVVYTGAVLELASPVKVGSVPSSAILASPSGHTCIVSSEHGRYVSHSISNPGLIDGELGADAVPLSLGGQEIVQNPADLPASVRQTCK